MKTKYKTPSTHCRFGHRLDEVNLYVSPHGIRACKKCKKEYNKNFSKIRRDKKEFGGNRELAIQRDGEKCVQCGMTRLAHKKKYKVDITVDHIDGKGRLVPAEVRNNHLSNLQTLCQKCHGRKDTPHKKLTAQQAKEIIALNGAASAKELGKLYKVHPTSIKNIWRGHTWVV